MKYVFIWSLRSGRHCPQVWPTGPPFGDEDSLVVRFHGDVSVSYSLVVWFSFGHRTLLIFLFQGTLGSRLINAFEINAPCKKKSSKMEWWKICPSTKHWPVFARQLGWCSGGSLILGCTDSWPEALRNVGKVCEEEMLQPEHIEIKLGKTTNMFSEFTTLKPRFIETTMFNTYILLGEGLYLAIFSYNVSIFLPKRHSVFLLGITSFCWAFFLAPASCLFLPFPTKVGRGQGSPILPPSASYYSQVGAVISAWMIRCLLLETLKSVQVTGRERGFRGWIHHTGSCDCHSDVLIALWPSSLGLSRFSPSQTYYSSFLPILRVSHKFLFIP